MAGGAVTAPFFKCADSFTSAVSGKYLPVVALGCPAMPSPGNHLTAPDKSVSIAGYICEGATIHGDD
jgi:hypothetical protein